MTCGKSQCMVDEIKSISVFRKHFYLLLSITQTFHAQRCKIARMQRKLSKNLSLWKKWSGKMRGLWVSWKTTQHTEVAARSFSVRKVVSKVLQNLQEKTSAVVQAFSCESFPVNLAKCLRAPTFYTICKRLLLKT